VFLGTLKIPGGTFFSAAPIPSPFFPVLLSPPQRKSSPWHNVHKMKSSGFSTEYVLLSLPLPPER